MQLVFLWTGGGGGGGELRNKLKNSNPKRQKYPENYKTVRDLKLDCVTGRWKMCQCLQQAM